MPEDTSGTAEHAIKLAYEKKVGLAFDTLYGAGSNLNAQQEFEDTLKKLNEARAVALRIAEKVEPPKAKAAGSDK